MQVLKIPKISNTCAQLINMPIGTRFIVENDYYGDCTHYSEFLADDRKYHVIVRLGKV